MGFKGNYYNIGKHMSRGQRIIFKRTAQAQSVLNWRMPYTHHSKRLTILTTALTIFLEFWKFIMEKSGQCEWSFLMLGTPLPLMCFSFVFLVPPGARSLLRWGGRQSTVWAVGRLRTTETTVKVLQEATASLQSRETTSWRSLATQLYPAVSTSFKRYCVAFWCDCDC